jgi:NodT family efflux transporter outer membrane factor (OMF) lipoprotein
MTYSKKLIYSFFILPALLTACSGQTNTGLMPEVQMDAFSKEGEVPVPDRWWTVFGDEHLNATIDSALISNFDLQTAWYRFREAQAIKRREASSFFPGVDAMAAAETFSPESASGSNSEFQAGLMAEYEVDLWGKLRSSADAEQFRANASYYDYQTAALSISAEIVYTWFQMAEANARSEVISQQVNTNKQVLELIRSRFGSGQIRRVDILRQEQLLEATREQLIYTELRRDVLENQLAVLMGRTPEYGISFSVTGMPEILPLPETGIPSELVQRRPDVRRAFDLVRAADRDLATAISSQYPRISLTASISSSGNEAGSLFEDWMRTFAGNLIAPVFRGGELKAEKSRAEAVKNQQVYFYGQTVLNAFREVEDALIQEKRQKQAVRSIERQLRLARETNEQIKNAYFNGVISYLDVLNALNEEQQLQREVLSEKLTLIEYRIALYRALAGGFDTPLEEAE